MKEFFQRIADRFIGFTPVDAVDILVISVLLYLLFVFLKRNNASVIFKCLWAVLIVGLLAVGLNMQMTGGLFRYLFTAFLVLLIVIFAMEVKRDIWKLNSGRGDYHMGKDTCTEEDLRAAMAEIVKAVQNLAKNDVGALIVFAQKSVPSHIIESGVVLNAVISSQLIETIFIDKAPMHDGAIVINNNRILAAGCFLPLSQEISIPKELGTRHRAAIGITEAEDVTSVVVSEETGVISAAQDGKIKRYIDGPALTAILEKVYNIESGGGKRIAYNRSDRV